MKKILAFLSLFFACNLSFAQTESEPIKWSQLPSYSAKSFHFEAGSLTYDGVDCKYVELKSMSGVTGYFIIANATFSVKKKKIEGKSTAIMIRLNPKDGNKFIKITEGREIYDKGFTSLSLLVLNDIFKRCYHSAMDALIPAEGDFTVDIFSENEGDVLYSYSNGKLEMFNINQQKNKKD